MESFLETQHLAEREKCKLRFDFQSVRFVTCPNLAFPFHYPSAGYLTVTSLVEILIMQRIHHMMRGTDVSYTLILAKPEARRMEFFHFHIRSMQFHFVPFFGLFS